MTLHDTEELDDDLRRGADEHLALAAALGVDNVVKAVVLAFIRDDIDKRTLHSPRQRRGPWWASRRPGRRGGYGTEGGRK